MVSARSAASRATVSAPATVAIRREDVLTGRAIRTRIPAMPSERSGGFGDIPETRYARSGDVHIAYQVSGSGPLDLVFVAGFVTHVQLFWDNPIFAHFGHRLGTFARLIRFDKRGTGMSDRVPIATLEERMDDVRDFRVDARRGDAGVRRIAEVVDHAQPEGRVAHTDTIPPATLNRESRSRKGNAICTRWWLRWPLLLGS
jgi:hypothetical protein